MLLGDFSTFFFFKLQLSVAVRHQIYGQFDSNFVWQGLEKRDRQCTYNVTLRLVHATIVEVEKQYVLHIVSVCL